MICGALQTLNEDAFEDVVGSERPSPSGEMFSQYLAPIRESSEIGSPPRLNYNFTNPNLLDRSPVANGEDSFQQRSQLRSHSLHDESLSSVVIMPHYPSNVDDTKLQAYFYIFFVCQYNFIPLNRRSTKRQISYSYSKWYRVFVFQKMQQSSYWHGVALISILNTIMPNRKLSNSKQYNKNRSISSVFKFHTSILPAQTIGESIRRFRTFFFSATLGSINTSALLPPIRCHY